METVVEHPEVDRQAESAVAAKDLEEARARVEAYLRAWKLPDAAREEVAAMALSCVEERLRGDSDCEHLRVAIEEAEKRARAVMGELQAMPPLIPQREPETHPMTMETSLTRLPSFRIIAGWFLLIALIVLAFIFTR